MSKVSIGNKIGNLRSKVLLGVLVLAVMLGLGSGLYASSADISADNSLSGQTSTFDPFSLTRTAPATLRIPFRPVLTSNLGDMKTFILLGEKTTLIKTMPTVRISSRPVLRSYFRPSFM